MLTQCIANQGGPIFFGSARRLVSIVQQFLI
jgi:hypothetical protein